MVKKGKRLFSILLAVLMLAVIIPPESRADTTQVRIIKECTSAEDLYDNDALFLFVDSADGVNYALSDKSKQSEDASYYYMQGVAITIDNGIISAPDLDNCIGAPQESMLFIGSNFQIK